MCGPKHCPMQTKITDQDLEGFEEVLKVQGAAEITAVKLDKAWNILFFEIFSPPSSHEMGLLIGTS